MNKTAASLILILSLICAPAGWAAQIKAYVNEFSVTGVQNKDELKGIIQTLLTSRLSSDKVLTIDTPAGAEITVTGSYLQFGKVFSVDAVARSNAGTVIARSFVQGESQDDLIPAIGKLAHVLGEGIARSYGLAAAPPATGTVVAAPVPLPVPSLDIVKPTELIKPAASARGTDVVTPTDIIKPVPIEKSVGASWVSQRLAGVMTGLAMGKILDNGDREMFVIGNRSLKYYRLGEGFKVIAEVAGAGDEKFLGVDTADLDGDGQTEVYLTVMSGDALVSRVFQADGKGLKKTADGLPYYFRGMELAGENKKIYVQQMSGDTDFYGDVFELVKSVDRYEMKNPIKLPRFAFLYNFNQFRDKEGKLHFIVFHPDGYLLVYNAAREELWRSNDKFGGSELYFQRPDAVTYKTTGDPNRWIFLQQRIVVTRGGSIILPQNAGFWVIGNSRAYGKSAVVALDWDGASLEEKWRTRQDQNYLADFVYDAAKKELLLLEVVKREGVMEKGASALYLKKVE